MDLLFLLLGALCLAEGIDLFAGKDFLLFGGKIRREDFDFEKLCAVEKWMFLIDGICSLLIGINRFPDWFEIVCMTVFAVTLAVHVYVFRSRKFRSGK